MVNEPVKPDWMVAADKARAKQAALPIEDQAKAIAAEVRAEIAPAGKLPPEQGWLSFAPMPSDLCRVSPFHPMSKAEIGTKAPPLEDLVIARSSWGELRYSGQKLSTFDEDVFLAVLALVDEQESRDGTETTTWRGAVNQILSLMGLKSDGAANYARVRRSIKYMRATSFEMVLKSGRIEGCGLIASYSFDTKTKQVRITVDPIFHELYTRGSVTRLDVERRAKLPGAVAKCIYRFAMSHKPDRWEGNWMHLARAINLPMDKPDKELRRMLRTALSALIRAGILTKASRLSGEVATLVRSSRSLAHRCP